MKCERCGAELVEGIDKCLNCGFENSVGEEATQESFVEENVLIGAIVSIVLVLAANQQDVASNISVSYVVDGVAVRSSASYAVVPTSESVEITRTSMTTNSGSDEFEINASEAQKTTEISPTEQINLNTEATKVVFEYMFENLAESVFSIQLFIDATTKVNMQEKYLVSAKRLEVEEYRTAITETELAPQQLTEEGSRVYIYVMAEIENINKNIVQ